MGAMPVRFLVATIARQSLPRHAFLIYNHRIGGMVGSPGLVKLICEAADDVPGIV